MAFEFFVYALFFYSLISMAHWRFLVKEGRELNGMEWNGKGIGDTSFLCFEVDPFFVACAQIRLSGFLFVVDSDFRD